MKPWMTSANMLSSLIEYRKNKEYIMPERLKDLFFSKKFITELGNAIREVYPDFDDFDDYDGLVKYDNSMPVTSYKVECKVSFVTPTNLEKGTTSKTWHKKLDVMVSTPSSEDTVVMSKVFSYFYFR